MDLWGLLMCADGKMVQREILRFVFFHPPIHVSNFARGLRSHIGNSFEHFIHCLCRCEVGV